MAACVIALPHFHSASACDCAKFLLTQELEVVMIALLDDFSVATVR